MPAARRSREQLARAGAERDALRRAAARMTSSGEVVDDVVDPHAHAGVLEDARRVLEARGRPAAAPARATTCRRSSRRAAVSAAIQYGSVSTSVPSMSHRTAARALRSLLHASRRSRGDGRASLEARRGRARHRGAEPILDGPCSGWMPDAGEEVGWTDWDARCSSPRSTGGTTPARRHRPRWRICARAASTSLCSRSTPSSTSTTSTPGPQVAIDGDGRRVAALAGGDDPASRSQPDARGTQLWLLTGVEPARAWQAFAAEFIDVALREDITGLRRARLDDVGRAAHAADLGLRRQRQRADARRRSDLERSTYEGPVGILSVLVARGRCRRHPRREPLGERAALRRRAHAVAQGDARAARPPRGPHRRARSRAASSSTESAAWEASIDAAAADDEEMTEYIRQLERTRDTWDSPEASGDAIAQEFERYLRRGGGGPERRRADQARPRRPAPVAAGRLGAAPSVGLQHARGSAARAAGCRARRGRSRTAGSCASRSSS